MEQDIPESTAPASPDFEIMGARTLLLSPGEGRRRSPQDDPPCAARRPRRERRAPQGGRDFPELPWLLRAFRERLALGRGDIASRCGCHANSVEAWETAKWVPSERRLDPLCEALRLSPSERAAVRAAARRDRAHVASLNLSGLSRRGRGNGKVRKDCLGPWHRRTASRARVERFRDRRRFESLGLAGMSDVEGLVADAERGIWRKEFEGRSGKALMAALARNGRSILLGNGKDDSGPEGHPRQDGVGGA